MAEGGFDRSHPKKKTRFSAIVAAIQIRYSSPSLLVIFVTRYEQPTEVEAIVAKINKRPSAPRWCF